VSADNFGATYAATQVRGWGVPATRQLSGLVGAGPCRDRLAWRKLRGHCLCCSLLSQQQQALCAWLAFTPDRAQFSQPHGS
jgi:hypothetical protein